MVEDHTASGARRRAQIVESATRILVGEGLAGFSLRAVAADVGIRLGNLQYYFPTRDDLLEAVFTAEFAAELAVLGPSDSDRAAAFRSLIERWLGPAGGVCLALWFLAGDNPRFARIHHDIYERFLASLAETLAGVDAREARRRARLATALLDGTAMQLRPPGGPTARERAAIIDEAVDLALGVLRDDPARRPAGRRSSGRRARPDGATLTTGGRR